MKRLKKVRRQFNNELQHLGKQKGECYPKSLWQALQTLTFAERDRIMEMLFELRKQSEIAFEPIFL